MSTLGERPFDEREAVCALGAPAAIAQQTDLPWVERANERGGLALLSRGNFERVDDRADRPGELDSATGHPASMDRDCLAKRCAFPLSAN